MIKHPLMEAIAEKAGTSNGDSYDFQIEVIAALEAAQGQPTARVCYLRFGRKDGAFPPNEQSSNAITGELELGVSVYEAVERDGKYQILLPRLDGTAPATLGMCFNSAQGLWGMENYPLFEVDGDLVGYGSDGEPLIKNCRVIRQIFCVEREEGK